MSDKCPKCGASLQWGDGVNGWLCGSEERKLSDGFVQSWACIRMAQMATVIKDYQTALARRDRVCRILAGLASTLPEWANRHPDDVLRMAETEADKEGA